jgi:uncharacterized membrane protein YdbT with pleckstrin-like domain
MDLHPSENVLYEGRPSWRSILHFYLLGTLAAAAGGAIAGFIWSDPGWGALVAAFILIVVLVAGWLQRIGTRYYVTNERLRIRRGILARRMQETRLERIQNVNTEQSILQRLLRIGTVDFDTAGGSDYDFAFRGVSTPETVAHTVDQAIREADATSPPQAADVPDVPDVPAS